MLNFLPITSISRISKLIFGPALSRYEGGCIHLPVRTVDTCHAPIPVSPCVTNETCSVKQTTGKKVEKLSPLQFCC